MIPVATRLVFVLLIGAAAADARPPADANADGLPRQGGEIRVPVRPGRSYLRTEGGMGVLQLLDCAAPGQDDGGGARTSPGRSAVARNASGDALEIPADAVPPQTEVQIIRHRGRPYRWVTANASAPVSSALLTIDLRGCTPAASMTIVRFNQGSWEDAGGQVQGTAITAQLPHLSIYAVAGN